MEVHNCMLPTILLYMGTNAIENMITIAIENDFMDDIGRRKNKLLVVWISHTLKKYINNKLGIYLEWIIPKVIF